MKEKGVRLASLVFRMSAQSRDAELAPLRADLTSTALDASIAGINSV